MLPLPLRAVVGRLKACMKPGPRPAAPKRSLKPPPLTLALALPWLLVLLPLELPPRLPACTQHRT